jgi:hypothetical protein
MMGRYENKAVMRHPVVLARFNGTEIEVELDMCYTSFEMVEAKMRTIVGEGELQVEGPDRYIYTAGPTR